MIVRIVYSKSPEAQKSRMFLTADHVLVDLEQDAAVVLYEKNNREIELKFPRPAFITVSSDDGQTELNRTEW